MAKKQDPLWSVLFEEIAKAKWGVRTEKTNIHHGRLKQAKEFHAEICADAEKILKRPPVMSDIDQDLVDLMVRKYVKTFTSVRWRHIQRRVDRLRLLADLVTRRFNRPAIDWQAIPTCRREMNANLGVVSLPVPEVSPDDLPAGLDPAIASTELTKVMKQYRRERLLGKSVHTGRIMDHAIAKFSHWLCRPAKLSDLNHDRVTEFLNHLLSRGELARASVRQIQERLQATWRYACQKHWLIDLPHIPLVSVPERTPDAWTPNEMLAILNAAKATQGNMKGSMELVPWSLFWSTLVYFLFDTGERSGAAIQVLHDDVRNGWVVVRAEYRKGQTRDKRFKLRQCTLDGIAELRKLTGQKVKRVFEFPYSHTYLWTYFGKVLDSAGLPRTRRNKFHKIRRTAASEFEAAGGNATKLLDHRSRATTMKYLDPKTVKETQLVDIVAGIGEQAMPTKDAQLMSKLRDLLDSNS